MKLHKSKMKTLLGTLAAVGIALAVAAWVWNGVKFYECDFASDFRCEVLHGAGLFIPFFAPLTVWAAVDER